MNFDKRIISKRKIIPKKIKLQILDASDWKCYYCKTDLKKTKSYNVTIDHLIHLYRGGTDNLDNLVACCRSCNSARGGLSASEFSAKINEKRKERMRILGGMGGRNTAKKYGKEFFRKIGEKGGLKRQKL